jgi:hypothetical protein
VNKQPFYHEVTFLFTATREFTRVELTLLLAKALKGRDVVKGTIDVESVEAEPGDPADLM